MGEDLRDIRLDVCVLKDYSERKVFTWRVNLRKNEANSWVRIGRSRIRWRKIKVMDWNLLTTSLQICGHFQGLCYILTCIDAHSAMDWLKAWNSLDFKIVPSSESHDPVVILPFTIYFMTHAFKPATMTKEMTEVVTFSLCVCQKCCSGNWPLGDFWYPARNQVIS